MSEQTAPQHLDPQAIALCEIPYLYLRRDQPYVFYVAPGCDLCAALARAAEGYDEPEVPNLIEYEWGTRFPSGNVCEWDTEEKARHYARISKIFPGVQQPLVRRTVGPWLEVSGD